MANVFAPGSVVISKAGRDSGKYSVVVGVEGESYVYLADGNLRRLAKPKKKKVKHVAQTPHTLTGIGNKLTEGKKVFDAEIRSALKNAIEAGSGEEEGGVGFVKK
jgi:ribosomal protein L14E/L6E/L27E